MDEEDSGADLAEGALLRIFFLSFTPPILFFPYSILRILYHSVADC